MAWFGVRCVVEFPQEGGESIFEEQSTNRSADVIG